MESEYIIPILLLLLIWNFLLNIHNRGKIKEMENLVDVSDRLAKNRKELIEILQKRVLIQENLIRHLEDSLRKSHEIKRIGKEKFN